MNEEELRNYKIYRQVAAEIRLGIKSWTEANEYLDSIDFDPEWRFPGLHLNDDGIMEHYIWQNKQWRRI